MEASLTLSSCARVRLWDGIFFHLRLVGDDANDGTTGVWRNLDKRLERLKGPVSFNLSFSGEDEERAMGGEIVGHVGGEQHNA
jgi:hypothetical protein